MSVPCQSVIRRVALFGHWVTSSQIKILLKVPKLQFPLCRLCDLHFSGTVSSICFRLLAASTHDKSLSPSPGGGQNWECMGRNVWDLWVTRIAGVSVYFMSTNRPSFVAARKAIITGGVPLITCKNRATCTHIWKSPARIGRYLSSHGVLLLESAYCNLFFIRLIILAAPDVSFWQ